MEILLRIIRLTLRHKWRLAGAYVCMVGATIAYMVLPRLFGAAVDEAAVVLEGGAISETAILAIVVAILAFSAVRGILSFGQTYLGEALGQTVVYHLRNRFYNHVQNLSFGVHDRQHTGNLMSRAITDVEAVRMFCNVGLIRSPYYVVLFVVVAVLLLRLDWRLGLVSMSFLPVIAVLVSFVHAHMRRIWLKAQEDMGELSTILQESMTGVRVVKAFAAEEHEQRKYEAKSLDVAVDMVRATRLQALNMSLMVFAFLIATGLILWYGGGRVIDRHLTWGELAQFLFYLQILTLPIRQAGMMVSTFARAMSAGQRLFEVLDIRSPVRQRPGAMALPRSEGRVRFENVSFAYKKGADVLEDINIDARRGEVIALLGAPGSGKSSAVHLIPRFYDVTGGRVTIDGVDVRACTLESLRRNVGIVQQDVFLFTATLRENIAYGREDATMDDIVRAASVAQMDDFIQGLGDGYETVVGERGATLSGGQRQRLSIARAVLLDPPILVLDDSTSSVDATTEERIRKAMEAVMRGRTTFVIAHRLSTVHHADQILVLDGGRIVERGRHHELLDLGGQYRQIYELQLRPQEDVMLDFDIPAALAVGGARS